MTVTNALWVIGWAAAATGLVCMAVYVYLAYREDERLWRLFMSSQSHERSRESRNARWFLIAAAVTFVFCLYKGAESALGWMPSSWGGFDEYHEFTPLQGTLAGMFALFVGGPLTSVIQRATTYAGENEGLRSRVKELERALRDKQ